MRFRFFRRRKKQERAPGPEARGFSRYLLETLGRYPVQKRRRKVRKCR
jgi:hypothetical protein